jgi:hypothetical protein
MLPRRMHARYELSPRRRLPDGLHAQMRAVLLKERSARDCRIWRRPAAHNAQLFKNL